MLTGKNVILRPLKFSDWEKTIQWRNDLEIKRLAMMHPYPITDFSEKQWFEDILKDKSNKVVYFAITNKDDNVVGFISLNQVNHIHRNCYMGIIVGDPDARGKGIGSEAIKLISDYAFNTLNMNKVVVEVISFNENAIRLYEKVGFVREGLMKNHFFANGVFHDVLVLSLFRKSI